ncbi:MAG: amidohydrolase family protein [Armatimonadota bacterium]|nr:amidohydrolase family protein [Armatimonadota bacterium]MDR7563466.1 amidohydrolase family protein [Armatimonadota bacterium]MDR7567738.1 amidohydrolase family protein [Armatimonadota bacterium]MDR7601601.1 amidohydrolase family protein [Armatimonadota bacterium]
MEIIDAHVHLITPRMLERPARWTAGVRARALEAASRARQRRMRELPGQNLEELAAWWEQQLDAHGVRAAFFIAVGEANEELAAFCALNPRRFYGWGSLPDPLHPDAPRIMARFAEWGLRGLKLYPPTQRFHANDRAVFPVYEKAAEMGIPVLFHFGVTVSPLCDLTYANPLDLSWVIKQFPEVTFGIAHFGAGFLRETLFLAYHTENVFVDTSGTNNWRLYHPGNPSLESVFADALRAFGPHRVVFGTDTAVGPYRGQILREQLEILERLGLSEEERAAVMGTNARRLFRLETSAPVGR